MEADHTLVSVSHPLVTDPPPDVALRLSYRNFILCKERVLLESSHAKAIVSQRRSVTSAADLPALPNRIAYRDTAQYRTSKVCYRLFVNIPAKCAIQLFGYFANIQP